MIILYPQPEKHSYRLIDSGDGMRLETFNNITLSRPDITCIWPRNDNKLWEKTDLICSKNIKGNGFTWQEKRKNSDSWFYSYHNKTLQKYLKFLLRTSPASKNIGIFPEQAAHWDWLSTQVKKDDQVLNLFAYTGGATLVAAAAGASVCHVDASKSSIQWAKENAQYNSLESAPIRWIVDDCITFMQREVKRGKKYNGIIMDPPAFGRDPQGKAFEFSQSIHDLLKLASQLLTKNGFLLLNAYSIPLYATHLFNIVQWYMKDKNYEIGELHLQSNAGLSIPCNIFVRAS